MKKYNISANIIRVIKNLYDKATSAVLFNSSIGDWFRTTICVRQECLLSSTRTLFNVFLERIKLTTDNTSGINTEIKVNGQKLETVISFKYLGLVITAEGSKSEILSRIAQTTAALTRLKPVWNDRSIISHFQDTTDALPCHTHLPVCL